MCNATAHLYIVKFFTFEVKTNELEVHITYSHSIAGSNSEFAGNHQGSFSFKILNYNDSVFSHRYIQLATSAEGNVHFGNDVIPATSDFLVEAGIKTDIPIADRWSFFGLAMLGWGSAWIGEVKDEFDGGMAANAFSARGQFMFRMPGADLYANMRAIFNANWNNLYSDSVENFQMLPTNLFDFGLKSKNLFPFMPESFGNFSFPTDISYNPFQQRITASILPYFSHEKVEIGIGALMNFYLGDNNENRNTYGINAMFNLPSNNFFFNSVTTFDNEFRFDNTSFRIGIRF